MKMDLFNPYSLGQIYFVFNPKIKTTQHIDLINIMRSNVGTLDLMIFIKSICWIVFILEAC